MIFKFWEIENEAFSKQDKSPDTRIENESKNTTKATNYWINIYKSWTRERNVTEEIETQVDLDYILERFYAEVVKQKWQTLRTKFFGQYRG